MSRYDQISRLVDELGLEVESLRSESRHDPVPIQDMGSLVKSTRKDQNLTQAELADLAGISPATLKRIESGNKDVTFSNIASVFDALGIDLWIG